MIDTIVFAGAWKTTYAAPPKGWTKVSSLVESDPDKTWLAGRPLTHVRFENKKLGIKLKCAPSSDPSAPLVVVSIEVSLPRILHGHNGMLLKDQPEINAALQKLFALIRQIATPIRDEYDHLTRLDLCWQIAMNPQELLRQMRHVSFMGMKRTAQDFGTGLFWNAAGSALRVYDKCAEMRRHRKQPIDAQVTRVEVQLRKDRLKNAFQGQYPRELNFTVLYDVFRKCLEPNFEVSTPGTSIYAFLAAQQIALERFVPDANVVEEYIATKPVKSLRVANSLRRKIAAIKLSRGWFSFASLFPESGPPEPAEVSTKHDAPSPTSGPAGSLCDHVGSPIA